MRASLRRRARRAGLVTVLAGSVLAAGSVAHASVGWSMYDYSGSTLVASGYGTVGVTASVVENNAHYQDRRADSYGAYVQTDFQPFWHSCYPDPATCRWEWGDTTNKQTRRIGTADGARLQVLMVARDWPTNRAYTQVCIDIPLRSDPCASSSWLYP
jgi:hypothetical protein